MPVIVAGYALTNENIPKFEVQAFKDSSSDELPKIIRTAIK